MGGLKTQRPLKVVRLPRRRPVEPPSTPLPATVLTALAAIVRDMRDVPRDCIVDRAELVIWLRRMAGRIEGVGRMRVPADRAARISGPVASTRPQPRAATPCDLADAVFGKALPVGPPGPRTITSRGRTVRVEVRRARAAGQMELGL